MTTAGEVKSEKGTAGRDLAVGIGPVRLPHYLARKEIVTRTDANQIDLAEYDHWEGSLQDDFLRNMMENLSLLLAGDRVSLFPWPAMAALDYRVGVVVMRFDGNRGGDVVLIANWTIREGQGAKVLRLQTSRIQEPSGGQGYEDMVGGMTRALGNLSREIAQAIKDDPGISGIDLAYEYNMAAPAAGFSRSQVRTIQANALRAAFLDDNEKAALLARKSGRSN